MRIRTTGLKMMNTDKKLSPRRSAAVISIGILASFEASHADYMQTLGQSQRSLALAGAFTAIADDTSVFYSNPAGATNFDRMTIGATINLLNTTSADLKDSTGNHTVDATVEDHEWATAPTLAFYRPINERWTFGLGFGAANGITGNWTDDDGIHRYNMSEQTLFTIDFVPTVAYEVSESLSLGLSLNVVAFKHLRTETLIPDTFGNALLAGIVAPPTPDSPIIGSFTLETRDTAPLGVPPGKFDPSWDEIGFTLGALWDVNDRWTLGATYRSEQGITFDGNATLAFPVLGFSETVDFSMKMDSPAFLQLGLAYKVIPDKLTWSLDAQWTRWSDAKLFGPPLEVDFSENITVPTGGGPADLTGVAIDYDANNTLAIRTGVIYRASDKLELMVGYAHDPSILDDDTIDILIYTSDRQWITGGFTYNFGGQESPSGWSLSGSLQYISYESRTIEAGESRNLGGLSLPNVDLATGVVGLVPNFEPFQFGGHILAGGLQITYSF